MKCFFLAASLSSESVNKRLIQNALSISREMGVECDLADFAEFTLPLYNADTEKNEGIPKAALAFVERMHSSDKVVISSPEYNFSMPGTLKNLIDWVSRIKPMPWKNTEILLLSASPSAVGGIRGLWSLRVPLEGCNAFVFPQMYSLPSAHEAFTTEGLLKDEKKHASLKQLLTTFFETSIHFPKKQ